MEYDIEYYNVIQYNAIQYNTIQNTQPIPGNHTNKAGEPFHE